MGFTVAAPQHENWGGEILNFALSLRGQGLEEKRIALAERGQTFEEARAATTDAYTKALTEQITMALDEKKKDLLDKEFQEKKRQAEVAAFAGQVDLSVKLKADAAKAQAEMQAYDEATDPQEKLRILFPHLQAQEMRVLQEQNYIQRSIIDAQRVDETNRHNMMMESNAIYGQDYGATIQKFSGTPSGPAVVSAANRLHNMKMTQGTPPAALAEAQMSYDETVKTATENAWKQELELKKLAGEQAQTTETSASASLSLAKNPQAFASTEDHQAYLNALLSGKKIGEDFALESEDQRYLKIPVLTKSNAKYRFVPLNRGNTQTDQERLLNALKSLKGE